LNYRLKLGLFLLCAVAILFTFNTAYQGLNTLSRLNAIEAERDLWQRPSDIIQALDLKPGNVVVDLGCGSGYFTLRLSPAVGNRGKVLAEDIRRLPLIFLWLRTFQRRPQNVSIVHGDPGNPHLPSQIVNAVLIANTYHEFTDSQAILVHVVQSLMSGGRLVVVDREPRPVLPGSTGTQGELHEITAQQVESELHRAGLEVVSRQDQFIQGDPYGENWWLITARKP
jgi:ubiquinone/menaquinone biosynthesis C-methylase UbiE